jgi:CubicO group peptidase (beta-lactamase class C family)
MKQEKLLELSSLIEAEHSNINGIVIVRNGTIAYERYFHGYGPEDTYHVASATKSIISALIGIAIELGYIRTIEQRVLEFFPEYEVNSEAGTKQEITLRNLLTMTAPYAFEDWQEPLDILCMQPDWVNYTLDILGHGGDIGEFKYCTAGAHLLSAIITRTTGKSAREFANEHLFQPIGMKEIPDYTMEGFGFDELFGKKLRGWVKDPNNITTGGWGLTLSPRDMARFGYLYLNNGVWDNRKIVSKSWIIESTAMNSNHYGYLWWLREEDGISAYLALGDGGNAICVVPEKDLVVAIASEFMLQPGDRWKLIKEQIIPAILN